VVPLVARDRTIGVMTFFHAESGRRYEAADVRFAEDLARRIASSLDNARLYRQAREAVRARDDLLSVVSHDLRSPLSAIHASADLMLRRLPPPPQEDGEKVFRQSAELVRRSVQHMSALIEHLLEATRLDAKQLQLHTRAEDPERILREAVELTGPLAARKKIALVAEVAGPLPRIRADRERLHQVLSNLLGNAVKFTPEGGKIVAGIAPLGETVCFSVADSGPGIAEADLEHIFDRFWQARKPTGLGVGLGLSIAKGLVESHGGRIWARSTPGRGATFSFTIPGERGGLRKAA